MNLCAKGHDMDEPTEDGFPGLSPRGASTRCRRCQRGYFRAYRMSEKGLAQMRDRKSRYRTTAKGMLAMIRHNRNQLGAP